MNVADDLMRAVRSRYKPIFIGDDIDMLVGTGDQGKMVRFKAGQQGFAPIGFIDEGGKLKNLDDLNDTRLKESLTKDSFMYADMGSPQFKVFGRTDDAINSIKARAEALEKNLKLSNPGLTPSQRKSLISKEENKLLNVKVTQENIALGKADDVVTKSVGPPSAAAPNPTQVADDVAKMQEKVSSLQKQIVEQQNVSKAQINSLNESVTKLETQNVRLAAALEEAQSGLVALSSRTPEGQLTTVAGKMDDAASDAVAKGSLGSRAMEWVKKHKFKILAAGTFGAVVGWAATAEARAKAANTALMASLGAAAVEHQKDLNGCFLYDRAKGTKTKIALLTCNNATLTEAIQTCLTQSYTAGGSALTACSATTFNPCVKDSTNRSGSGPMAPNACSKYLYKGTKPTDVAGVTTIDACKTESGAALGANQSCSVYCKTENFDLPPMVDLLCVSVDLPTAFVDLITKLGIDPEKVYPPKDKNKAPPAAGFWSQPASTPLLITTGILGGVLLILLSVYLYRKKSSLVR